MRRGEDNEMGDSGRETADVTRLVTPSPTDDNGKPEAKKRNKRKRKERERS